MSDPELPEPTDEQLRRARAAAEANGWTIMCPQCGERIPDLIIDFYVHIDCRHCGYNGNHVLLG